MRDSRTELIDRAIALARVLQQRANQLQTPAERRQQAELDRMLQHPEDKATLVQMTDQAFRSRRAQRTVDQFAHILDVQGIPRFFSPIDRALLRGFQHFGGWLPGVAAPLVMERMQHETANVVLPAEHDVLSRHLRERTAQGLRMNVNFLGEALLGEAEAQRRLDGYLEALQLPEIEVLSVKISTLYSQISALAREHTVRVLCDRLERLFREAARLRFTRSDGTSVSKFIYLDMEEYRDLRLTAEAFMRTLDRRGLEQASAGIALQAYIPDSARVQREINEWARQRIARGGAPVTIRIVKGANMEMERVEASLRGWPQAPFKTKRETDANYKRMLHEAMRAENLAAVRVGVASHNLFDLAYGLVLAAETDAGDAVQFEMLEGMANQQRRALFEETRRLLLYAPACRKEEFINAIGYLIRRLDENTGPENFLRHAFQLQVGSPEWERLERDFRACFDVEVSDAPRRTQNRQVEGHAAARPLEGDAANADAQQRVPPFQNEPDTDFSLPQNSDWAKAIVAQPFPGPAIESPLIAHAQSGAGDIHQVRECLDPSRPGKVLARYSQASEEDVERAIATARDDPDGWRSRSIDERSEILGRVAEEIRQARGRLIHAAVANGGKTFAEADPEVSEAVDFCEFYRRTARVFHELPTVHARGRGVVVVVSPWNFPIAIPCGGIAAALAAGNTVILKPSSDAVLVAAELCECFERGGVSRATLQFLPCSGGGAGRRLVTHRDVNAVILTGGTATAREMLRERPDMALFAETGGKNATIVTALSDRELAVRNVVHSAFSHSGQKCSATSLLLLEAEVYDDPEFKQLLCDAIESLHVGSAWELHTRVGPLIRPPSGVLEHALKTLEPGESWAVTPRQIGDNPNLWSPGVKWGVQPRSTTHMTELFGPVLGVMRFETLEEAIGLVNATGYGLTSGLESLDDREQAQWKAGIRAGNLYINRPTTGAIVLRQPFGGMGKSCFGPGIKAGGPNYVAQFMEFESAPIACHSERSEGGNAGGAASRNPVRLPGTAAPITSPAVTRGSSTAPLRGSARNDSVELAVASYEHCWTNEFSREHDDFRLLGEDNFRRYLPVRDLRVRVDARDSTFEVFARVFAGHVVGARVTVSSGPGEWSPDFDELRRITASWQDATAFVEESDSALADLIRDRKIDRIRFAAPDRVPEAIRRAAAEAGHYIADAPVLAEGRIELLWYLREQSSSYQYHRYGNLGARAGEARMEPA